MVLAAGQRDDLVIAPEDLALADISITDVERELPKVFAKIGRTEESIQAERFIKFVHSRGAVPYEQAYQYIHAHFPAFKGFEDMLKGAQIAGYVDLIPSGNSIVIAAKKPPAPK
jgi:hypothetical protein